MIIFILTIKIFAPTPLYHILFFGKLTVEPPCMSVYRMLVFIKTFSVVKFAQILVETDHTHQDNF